MTLPLILAIEPDPHKALQLKSIARQVNAELRLAGSIGEALAAFSERIPDLILIPALIMARDDLALTERLRELGAAAAHIQTLTIPILETAEMTLFGSGVFGTPRRQRTNLGCEAGTFAEQVGIYLERATEARQKYSLPSTPAAIRNHAFVDELSFRHEEPAVMSQAPSFGMPAGMNETRPPVGEPSLNAAPPWAQEFVDIAEGALLLPAGELAAVDETPVSAEVSFEVEGELLPPTGELASVGETPRSAEVCFDMGGEALPPAGELAPVGETPRSVEVSFDMEGEPLRPAGELAPIREAPMSVLEFFRIEDAAQPPTGELAAADKRPPFAESFFRMEEALPRAQELRVVDRPPSFGVPDFAEFKSEELLAPESIPAIAAPQPAVGDPPTVFFRQIKAAISNSLPDVMPEGLPALPPEDRSIVVPEALPLSDALSDFASQDTPAAGSEEAPPSDTWQLLDPDQDRFSALIVKLDAIAVNGV